MPFPYKKVLVVGATSGIGLALTEKIIVHGSHVIAVGRRKDRLDSLVQKYGSEKVSPVQFDIANLERIPSFIHSYIPLSSFRLLPLTFERYCDRASGSRFCDSKCRRPTPPRFLFARIHRSIPRLGRINNELYILHPHPQISPSALPLLQISRSQVHHLYLQRSRSRSDTKSSRLLR